MINFTETLSNPNVQAFLRVIRAGETSQNDVAYRMMFGGGLFDDFSHHPNIVNEAVGLHSTAAGAYQFLYRTWQALCAKYNFPDFSPHSQDLGAIALIIGRGAIDDVQAGRFDEAIAKCNKEWASLPGSPYGQPTRDLSALREVYVSYGGTLAGSDVQPETVTSDTSDKPAPIVESKPVFTRKPTVEPLSILSLGITALSKLVPALSQMFPGGEVAERNAKAATVLLETAKDSIKAVNTQDLVTKIDTDPSTHASIIDSIATLVEVGGGIPAAAARAVEMQKAGPLYSNPAFVITLLLLVPVYAFFASVLGFVPGVAWDDNIRMLVAGIISNVISGAMGFWLGSSFGSQKKDALNK